MNRALLLLLAPSIFVACEPVSKIQVLDLPTSEPEGDETGMDGGELVLLDYTAPLPAHYTQPSGPVPSALALDNTPAHNPITDAGATLGRVLFYDRDLSMNSTVACASCHQQEHGFGDSEALSEGFDGGSTGRHSMGIVNARFFADGRFFWDLRADSLEDQVLMPIQDSVEMGMTLEDLEAVVASADYYEPLFAEAFGDNAVSSERISLALAQFIRAMASTETRYDDGRRLVNNAGQPFPNFTDEENRGKQLFLTPPPQGGAGCAACHGTDAFVGVGPGAFNNGLDADTSEDEGVFATTGRPADRGVFKIPSLRSTGLRAPYMHDGRFDTLEQVVEHYNAGVQPHPNLAPQLQLPPAPGMPPLAGVQPVRLNLSEADVSAIVAFLHTLDDQALAVDERFSDPFVRSE